MAPPGSSQTLLSPAELSFIHSSLSAHPPIRPDLRSPTEFRPLIAETDILPCTNGSARICFSDGTEAMVGVKAEVEKSQRIWKSEGSRNTADTGDDDEDGEENKASQRPQGQGRTSDAWLEVSVDIPGFREDDNLPVFLSAMLAETLQASNTLQSKLYINERWHWKLFIDVLLLSTPLSYPLPLLSLTTHLALLNTVLPRVTSEPSDDPIFDDDWAAAVPLFPTAPDSGKGNNERPPITLLVMTVGENIIFDPSKEELAVAESVLALSVTSSGQTLRLLAIRTVDPPSRLTPPGIPNSLNPVTNAAATPSSGPATPGATQSQASQQTLTEQERDSVWTPPSGGMKRALLARILKMVVGKDGVAAEVLEALAAVES